MEQEFTITGQARVHVAVGSGDVVVHATETDRVRVELDAPGDDGRSIVAETVLEQRGDEIVVETPRRSGFLRRSPSVDVRLSVPTGTQLEVRTDSADVAATGAIGESRVQSGSGDVRLERVDGPLQVSTGSGDISVRTPECATKLSSGSGSIEVEQASGPMQLNTASGDIRVGEAADDVTASTASGDQQVDRLGHGKARLSSASGDVVAGVTDGIPVWLDVNTLSGSVSSDLSGSEAPPAGTDYLELRVNTASGDIVLTRA